MQYLSKGNEKNNKKYVRDVFLSEDGSSIYIEFADGKRYKGQYTPKKLAEMSNIMEHQAEEGITNLGYFKLCNVGCLTGAFTSVLGSITALRMETYLNSSITAGCMLVGLGAATFFYYEAVKNYRKITEIEKIQYRNAHQQELVSLGNYENALANIQDPSLLGHIEENTDPFSAIYSDMYTKEDLEKIVKDVKREKRYGFTYKKIK